MTAHEPIARGQSAAMPVGDIRAALGRLSAAVAEKRAGFDAAGRLPDALFDDLAALGLFRLLLPARLGGHELSVLDYMDVVEDAAALDGTIGWLVGNGGGMGRVGGFLAEAEAREIFDDPKAFIVAGTGGLGKVVAEEGGWRVNGRWAFGSGAHHSTWFSPVCEVHEDGAPTGRKVLVYARARTYSCTRTGRSRVSALPAVSTSSFAMPSCRIASCTPSSPSRPIPARSTGCRRCRSFPGPWRPSPSASPVGPATSSCASPAR